MNECGMIKDRNTASQFISKSIFHDKRDGIRIFISQPMSGLEIDEIKSFRKEALIYFSENFAKPLEMGDIHVIDNLQEDENYPHALYYLGNDIKMLADADLAYFVGKWNSHRGCVCECTVCCEYDIPFICRMPDTFDTYDVCAFKREIMSKEDCEKYLDKYYLIDVKIPSYSSDIISVFPRNDIRHYYELEDGRFAVNSLFTNLYIPKITEDSGITHLAYEAGGESQYEILGLREVI